MVGLGDLEELPRRLDRQVQLPHEEGAGEEVVVAFLRATQAEGEAVGGGPGVEPGDEDADGDDRYRPQTG
jgi:hypothetical protein